MPKVTQRPLPAVLPKPANQSSSVQKPKKKRIAPKDPTAGSGGAADVFNRQAAPGGGGVSVDQRAQPAQGQKLESPAARGSREPKKSGAMQASQSLQSAVSTRKPSAEALSNVRDAVASQRAEHIVGSPAETIRDQQAMHGRAGMAILQEKTDAISSALEDANPAQLKAFEQALGQPFESFMGEERLAFAQLVGKPAGETPSDTAAQMGELHKTTNPRILAALETVRDAAMEAGLTNDNPELQSLLFMEDGQPIDVDRAAGALQLSVNRGYAEQLQAKEAAAAQKRPDGQKNVSHRQTIQIPLGGDATANIDATLNTHGDYRSSYNSTEPHNLNMFSQKFEHGGQTKRLWRSGTLAPKGITADYMQFALSPSSRKELLGEYKAGQLAMKSAGVDVDAFMAARSSDPATQNALDKRAAEQPLSPDDLQLLATHESQRDVLADALDKVDSGEPLNHIEAAAIQDYMVCSGSLQRGFEQLSLIAEERLASGDSVPPLDVQRISLLSESIEKTQITQEKASWDFLSTQTFTPAGCDTPVQPNVNFAVCPVNFMAFGSSEVTNETLQTSIDNLKAVCEKNGDRKGLAELNALTQHGKGSKALAAVDAYRPIRTLSRVAERNGYELSYACMSGKDRTGIATSVIGQQLMTGQSTSLLPDVSIKAGRNPKSTKSTTKDLVAKQTFIASEKVLLMSTGVNGDKAIPQMNTKDGTGVQTGRAYAASQLEKGSSADLVGLSSFVATGAPGSKAPIPKLTKAPGARKFVDAFKRNSTEARDLFAQGAKELMGMLDASSTDVAQKLAELDELAAGGQIPPSDLKALDQIKTRFRARDVSKEFSEGVRQILSVHANSGSESLQSAAETLQKLNTLDAQGALKPEDQAALRQAQQVFQNVLSPPIEVE